MAIRLLGPGAEARAADSLESSDQLFQTAFESAAIGMFLVRLDGVFVQANRAFCEMLGYSEQELRTKSFADVTFPEDVDSSRKCSQALLSGECARYWFSKRYVRKDGIVVWADASVCLLRDAEGNPQYFLTQAQDISEQRRAREQLSLERQNLRGIMVATPNPMYLVNQAHEVEYANPALTRELGPPNGRKCYAYMYGRSDPCPTCVCDEVWRGGRGRLELTSEVTGRTYDVLFSPINRQDGSVAALCTLHDITERRRTEEALRANEARYRNLFENTGAATFVFDQNTLILLCNSKFQALTGYMREELEGKMRWSDFAPPEDLADLQAYLEAARQDDGPPREFVTRCVHRSGEIKEVHVSVGIVPGSQELIASVLDITHQRLSEQKLYESEKRYRLLFNSSPVAIAVSRAHRVLYANEAYTRLFGYRDSLVLAGKSVLDAVAPQCREEIAERTRRWERGEEAPQMYETVGLRADGSQFPLQVEACRFNLADGPTVLAFLSDVTARRSAEQAQRLAAIGELSAGVAHDFNNLLTCMSGAAQMVEAGRYEPAKLVQIVMDSTRQGAGITRDLMAFARPQEPRRELGHIETSVDAALSVAHRQIENSEVQVVRDYDPHARPLHFDKGQMEQVFLNLLINACHAMPSGGVLTVTTRYPSYEPAVGQAIVTVTDTGVGITEKNLTRVFEPFFTTKGGGGTNDLPGTGLGLSASHGVVTAHGGTITVRSEPGAGASFEIRLPAPLETAAGAAAVPVATPPENADERLRRAKILVVDDQETIVRVLQHAFSLRQCTAIGATTTAEAIASLRAEPFDLIVSDLMMFGGGARTLLEFVKTMECPPPMVVITGRLERALHDELVGLGASQVIEKPFRLVTVLEAAVRLLQPQAA